MRFSRAIVTILLGAVSVAGAAGCRAESKLPQDQRTRRVEQLVLARWGKPIAQLPAERLVAISPHNENILDEFTWAFMLQQALERGRRVEIVWRDVGGGGSAIEKYLFNVYADADSCDIDILWGGGDSPFIRLAAPYKTATRDHSTGLLESLAIDPEVLAQIGSPGAERPNEFGGLALYDRNLRWVGSAVSSFGFLYNRGMLRRCNIAPPVLWDDVGDARFTGLVTLADPSQSGSVAQTYRLIVQSEPTWPRGWAKLLAVLSNANRISDSAGAAANSPVLGDSLVASCIDFYGLMRVAEAPDQLAYVSPAGQTTFGSDPIGILKNPPHPELAREFVDFVMSRRGQALWALRVGTPDGPVRNALGRLPIRRDVYGAYRGELTASVVNFYELPQTMSVSKEMDRVNFAVLRQLVVSAAVDNIDGLRAARRRLNELAGEPARAEEYRQRLAEFNSLPPETDTLERMNAAAGEFRDPVRFYRLTVAWRDFFRAKYQAVSR